MWNLVVIFIVTGVLVSSSTAQESKLLALLARHAVFFKLLRAIGLSRIFVDSLEGSMLLKIRV